MSEGRDDGYGGAHVELSVGYSWTVRGQLVGKRLLTMRVCVYICKG